MFRTAFRRLSSYKFHSKLGPVSRSLLVTVPIVSYFLITETISLDTKNAFTDFKKISIEEIVKHDTNDDLWVVIHGKVYDLTEFAMSHPGGANIILKYAGKDATDFFRRMHSIDVIEKMLPGEKCLGELDGVFEDELQEMTEEELQILERIKNKPELNHIFSISDFEYVCKQILPRSLFMYYATGSEDEMALRNNHYAYQRVFFKPRVLTDTSEVDLSTTMCDETMSLPLYVTAFAGQGMADPEGELNVTRVAQKYRMMQMIPILSSKTMDEISLQTEPGQPQWCQLHFETAKDFEQAELTIARLCSYDSVKAIFINADLNSKSNREKDLKMRAHQQLSTDLNKVLDPSTPYPTLTWDDLLRFQRVSTKPVLIKGLQTPEDILKASELGFRGCVISNHGGRQLDYSKPPLETLAETMPKLRLAPYYDKNKFDIYIDGGIRRGTDIIKALSLGATAVGMGRPFAYALASYGEKGCDRLVSLLQTELERDMKLLGCNDVKKLNENYLDVTGLYHRFNGDDKMYNLVYEPMTFPKFKN